MSDYEGTYEVSQCLRHHAGSLWEIIEADLPGDGSWGEGMCLLAGDYRIRCVEGTVREGFIGGEVEGNVRRVHADYLHGDGWRAVTPLNEGSETTPS